MNTKTKKVVGSTLVAFAGLVYTTFVLTHVAQALSEFSSDRKAADQWRMRLGNDVLRLTGDESEELSLLVDDLLPQAELRSRCESGSLPALLAPRRNEVCAEAAKQEILEEYAHVVAVRKLHSEGEFLQRQILDSLDSRTPGERYNTVLVSLDAIRALYDSSVCGKDRLVLADRLGKDRSWFTIELKDNLVGPRIENPSGCFDHGPSFSEAVTSTLKELALEADGVASSIRGSGVKGTNDSAWKLALAALDPPTVVLAAVAAVLAVLGWLFQKGTGRPTVSRSA